MTNRTRRLPLSLLTALLALLLTAGCSGDQTAETPDPNQDPQDALDALVADTLLDGENLDYPSAECAAEGHIILDVVQESDTRWQVYLLSSSGTYGFCSGHFEEISGSGAIPARMTVAEDGDGNLTVEDVWLPQDGTYYAPSIRETFPEDLQDAAFSANESYDQLKAQKEVYAQAYLDSIGREAPIGSYGDFEHPLPTNLGLSVEVSNALLDREDLFSFPSFIGNVEAVENGVRYVYETAWDHQGDGNGTLTYTKSNYETGEVVLQYTLAVTGDTFIQQPVETE